MPRQLSAKPCEMTFYDKISDSRITLCYRMPTTEELIAYANAQVTRQGNKIKSTLGEARMKYGAIILTGFKKGAFENEDGTLLSAEPGAGYHPEWKSLVKQHAADLIEALAIQVFEASVVRDTPDDPEDDAPNPT